MWVEFVVGSCPCSKGFSPGSLVFLPPQIQFGPEMRATGLSAFLLSASLNKVD